MKKIVPILLSSALVFPTFGGVSAHAAEGMDIPVEMKMEESDKTLMEQAEITKEEALSIAESFYNVPKEYKQQAIRFHSNWYMQNSSVWQIEYRNDQKDVSGQYTITVDSKTGNVVEANHYVYKQNQEPTSYPPEVNWEKAQEIGSSFISTHFPQLKKRLTYDSFNEKYQKPPLNGHFVYDVRFLRTVNNLPFQDNFISIRINGDGEIQGFNYRWNEELKFPANEDILSQQEILKEIKESLPLQLQYKRLYEMNYYMPMPSHEEAPLVLAYENKLYSNFINAKTGEWLTYEGKPVPTKDLITKPKPLLEKALQTDITYPEKQLTSDQALEVFKQHFTLPDGLKVENVTYDEVAGPEKKPVWRFNWRSEKEGYWIGASVNARTGEIIDFYRDIYYGPTTSEQDSSHSYEEAKEIAIEKLKELIPSKLHLLSEEQNLNNSYTTEKQREYYFNFTRLEDGIPFPDQNISISVSAEDGSILRFYQNWNDSIEFVDSSNVIDTEKAINTYLTQFDLQAKYVSFQNHPHTIQGGKEEEQETPITVVYELRNKPKDEPLYLDAISGNWTSSRSGEIIIEQVPATDIEGHWAEKELQLMIDYNAIKVDKDGNVYPNQKITRGEMVKMIMLTTNPEPYFYKMRYEFAGQEASFDDVASSSSLFPYVELAVRQGLIDKAEETFNPNDLVTREELAELIVRALRLYELSKVEGLFNLDFKDEEKIKQKGTVAIVQHLNIMNGNDGNFLPDQEVTRAVAATVYYNYLKKRELYTK